MFPNHKKQPALGMGVGGRALFEIRPIGFGVGLHIVRQAFADEFVEMLGGDAEAGAHAADAGFVNRVALLHVFHEIQ